MDTNNIILIKHPQQLINFVFIRGQLRNSRSVFESAFKLANSHE